jgi:glyoxalase family protein
MGFRHAGDDGSRFRFHTGEAGDTAAIDLLCQPEGEPGRMGIGAVHHIAWRTASNATQMHWRALLAGAGLDVTPVLDRQYFRSIYYREPGGVLFEIATDPPGFTVDESPDELGTHLKLPWWLESRRDLITPRLPEIRLGN